MYLAEVLNKLPVMQHFLFGSILAYDGPPPPLPDSEGSQHAHGDHTHLHTPDSSGMETGRGDCCGIPIPAAFAAARDAEQRQPGMRIAGPGIRPVPFD
jgi:serine/threonine-protein phosphatase 2A activator